MTADHPRQVELLGRLDELMRVFVEELGHDAALYNFRAVAERIRGSGFVPELAIVFAPSSEPRNSQSTGKEAA